MVPLLVPAAETLGIDLIWFGVILGINLQTSFLTPPFGFSLFYLRSIAPMKEWKDKVSGRILPAVKTTEIYKGAIPFIIIQFLMIILVIAFPGLVTHYKQENTVNPNEVEITIPTFGGGSDGGPAFGLPGGLSGSPFGSPPTGDGNGQQNNGLQLPGIGGLPPLARSPVTQVTPRARRHRSSRQPRLARI